MSTDEYVPSDEDVRESYVTGQIRDGYGADWDDLEPGAVMDFDAWLAAHDARVRRDAAREALDGLGDNYQRDADYIDRYGTTIGHMLQRVEVLNRQAEVHAYRDTHYPIPEETP